MINHKHRTQLSPQRQAYAEARARGLTMTEAAREAGSKRPSEAGTRWDKLPDIIACVADLKDRALAVRTVADALAAQVGYSPSAQVAQAVTQVAQAAVARRIASRDDALAIHTGIMESRIGDYITADGAPDVAMIRDAPPGVIKGLRWKDGVLTGLQMESSSISASAILGHYEGKGPAAGSTTINLGVIVSKLPEEAQRQLARAMLASDGADWTAGPGANSPDSGS